MNTELQKNYLPKDIEDKWYKEWEAANCFSPTFDKNKPNFSIVIPPPNVTGSLHMGHAFQDTIMDVLTRWNKMQQHNTLWQMGTDHAGIATQMVVERQLIQQGTSRHDLGREIFLQKVWEWKDLSSGNIKSQLKRLGASVDWEDERFTLDKNCNEAVNKVFEQLFDEGLIYRGQKLVNWDPSLKTAVSDLEVKSEEENGFLWHISYKLVTSKGDLSSITIATTRPETMFGDTAIAVNPDDERYNNLIGSEVIIPIADRRIKIIADEYVETEFGTGCVKITPAHDFNDNQIGQRHNLEIINILNDDGTLNNNVPVEYQGLDRFVARKKLIKALEELEQLVKTEPYKLKVPRCDRTNEIVEPYLTNQWFVKIAPLAKPAIEAVKSGDIKFVPQNWDKTYFDWMNKIEDWCISRQLWWGHRIPAWYDQDGNIYVGATKEYVLHKYNLPDSTFLTQDDDVLDTWFSSALWPFSSLGWPYNTDKMEQFYPTSVLVTGFDIIFFWVARMIMFGLKFTGKVPFSTVYIHGLIQDANGQKMSKSKGNVIDPIDLIDGINLSELLAKRTTGLMQPEMANKIKKQTEKDYPEGIPSYGTDALRFTLCSLATNGRHLRFDMRKMDSNHHFCNKLWNAARFMQMHLGDYEPTPIYVNHKITRWILHSFNEVKARVNQHLDNYRFDLATKEIYDFAWYEFCDWFIEFIKPELINKTKDKNHLLATSLHIFNQILLLAHPFMPFITSEIYSNLNGHQDAILVNFDYPKFNDEEIFLEEYNQIELLKNIMVNIRNLKSENKITFAAPVDIYISNENKEYSEIISLSSQIKFLAKVKNIFLVSGVNLTIDDGVYKTNQSVPKLSATSYFNDFTIALPLASFINVEEENARINKELVKLQIEIDKLTTKLNNKGFTDKAPKEVIQKETEKLQELTFNKQKLEEKQSLLKS